MPDSKRMRLQPGNEHSRLGYGWRSLDTSSASMFLQLPRELLTAIFHYVDDDQSLENLGDALVGLPEIQDVVLTIRWKSTTIDERDLVPEPGDDTIKFNNLQEILQKLGISETWKAIGHQLHKLLKKSRTGRLEIYPANYVQELTFDFRMWRYWLNDQKKTYILEGFNAVTLMPSIPTLEYSLGLLQPHLTNVHSIQCHGTLCDSLVNKIMHWEPSEIRSIELQKLDGSGYFRCSNPRLWPPRFEDLRRLHRLESLKIYKLIPDDVHYLVDALPRLVRLRTLTLADKLGATEPKPPTCGIQAFIERLTKASGASGESAIVRKNIFPSSLETLEIIDIHNKEEVWDHSIFERGILDVSVLNLEICSCTPEWTTQWLKCFPKQSLQNLAMPASRFAYDRPQPLVDFDAIVTEHHKSLKRLHILHAFSLDPSFVYDFNKRWSKYLSIQELVLGGLSDLWGKIYFDEWAEQNASPLLTNYLEGWSYLTGPHPGQWGDEIQRLRIDKLTFDNLDVSTFGAEEFAKVRILMLQPYKSAKSMCIDNCCKTIDVDIIRELAERVLMTASRTLQVLVIQSHWFWLARSSMSENGFLPNIKDKVWCWNAAEKDPIQYTHMRNSLTELDWTFLNNTAVPFADQRCIRNLINKTSLPTAWETKPTIAQRWNYVAALPLQSPI